MLNLSDFLKSYRLWRNGFSPYFKTENEFIRQIIIHAVGAFIVMPIYSIIVYFLDVPVIYFYIGISLTVLYPLYVFISWKINFFRDKLVYLFIGHLYVITLITYSSIAQSNFDTTETYLFFGILVVCISSIQRWYSLLIYILLVLFLLMYSFYYLDGNNSVKSILTANLFIISASSLVILFAKLKMISSIEHYSGYLQNIINSTGEGFILFDYTNDVLIVDYNKEVGKIFGLATLQNSDVLEVINKHFSKKEKEYIKNLSIGNVFSKEVKLNQFGSPEIILVNVKILPYKKNKFHLLRIENITTQTTQNREIQFSEKKYRNLYQKNKAGVFTINKNSIILKGNTSFFKMLDECYKVGDRLFPIELQKDWDIIIDSLGTKEFTQNYQTSIHLSNGVEKTLVFNWYLDIRTNYIEGSVIDLTNIQKASLALKQSEEKYRLIYEETNDAILFLDQDKILDSNRKATQLFGLNRDQLIGKKLFDLSFDCTENNRDNYEEIREENSNKRNVKFDWEFKGNNKKIEAKVALIEVNLDNKLYFQCVIHDYTRENHHIKSIERSQKNLENILENHPEGIIISSDENEVLYANPEIHVILGDNIHSLFNTDKDNKLLKILSEHHEDKKRKRGRINVVDVGGNEILMDVTFGSTIYEDKNAVLIIFKDVSEDNKVQREQMRAEIAEESNKALEIQIKEKIKAEKELEEQFLRMKAILESSSNTFLLTLTLEAEVSTFNSHCKAYFATILRNKIKKGSSLYDYFNELNELIESRKMRLFPKIIEDIKKGKSKQFELDIEANGIHHWLEIFINPIFNTEGKVSEISIVAHDISEKKMASIEIVSSLNEKEILLKEIHHRVKNNLQVISSILNLQSSYVEDEKTLSILQESRNRVRTMAIIHENLYRTEDFSSINFTDYIDNLTGNLISSYRTNVEVRLEKELEQVQIVLDQAIPCGLILNEIITNSLKYAWAPSEKGIVNISLKEKKEVVFIEISDDGIGLPFDFKNPNTDTLGLQLVLTLIDQLDGEINVDTQNGTKYLINFDKIKP